MGGITDRVQAAFAREHPSPHHVVRIRDDTQPPLAHLRVRAHQRQEGTEGIAAFGARMKLPLWHAQSPQLAAPDFRLRKLLPHRGAAQHPHAQRGIGEGTIRGVPQAPSKIAPWDTVVVSHPEDQRRLHRRLPFKPPPAPEDPQRVENRHRGDHSDRPCACPHYSSTSHLPSSTRVAASMSTAPGRITVVSVPSIILKAMISLSPRRSPLALFLGSWSLALCALFAGTGLPAHAANTQNDSTAVYAAPPSSFENLLTDEAGVLSPEESAQLSSALSESVKNTHRPLYIVYLSDTNGMSAEAWARQAGRQLRSNEAAVLAIVPNSRDGGVWTGSEWPSGSDQHIWDAAYPHLVEKEWGKAGLAAAEATTRSSSSALKIIGVGAGVAIPVLGAAVGGSMMLSRRSRRKKQEGILRDAQKINPEDLGSIAKLPTDALRALAEEELKSTDVSVRRAREELDRAQQEFGVERTRPFIKALNHSTTTLQQAFYLRERLYDDIPESEDEQRRLLIEVISSCGQADKALDSEAEHFAAMRRKLIDAPSTINALFGRSIEMHRRLEAAKATLADLHTRHSASILRSLDDNPEAALEALTTAEAHLNEAQQISEKPAGQQQSLIDILNEADSALSLADAQLRAIENAEDDLRNATARLDDLIAEIREEINEAAQLSESGRQHGAPADWEALDRLVQEAETELKESSTEANEDPLSAYSRLTALDARLDDALDRVRAISADQARRLALYDQAVDSAQALIRQAEDLLATRSSIIGTEARTRLREAQRLLAEALTLRVSDTPTGTTKASDAGTRARQAYRLMREDIRNYEQNLGSNGNSNSTGALIAGLVANALIQGSNGGFGRGGGFGGGGFGGGGFGGGGFGGGSSTGGRF